MRVIEMRRFGGPEVLEVVERPVPCPAPGQVLVRVKAAGVNLAETLMRENRYAMTPELPAVLGTEAAGVIEAVGDGVEGLRPGMRVAAPLFGAGSYFGGYADYVAIAAELAVPVPEGLSFDASTALMIQGLTALYLTKQISPAGKTVLVSAAAGGVGSLLVQLAKRAGAKKVIAAASSAEKLEFARALGADQGVDYTRAGWVDAVQGVDLIYESVGGPVTMQGLQALGPGGELVIYGALNIQEFQLGIPELVGMIFKNQSLTGFALAPLLTAEGMRAGLQELFAMTVRGELRVEIGGRYPLEQAREAHRALESRGTRGKLVLVA